MFQKSSLCVGKATGQPLTEYHSRQSADDGSRHALAAYGNVMVPYKCAKCDHWHLAPAARQTPSSTCHACAGRDGQPKQAYASEDAAERRAEILRRERGVDLTTYSCPYGSGWHLTKG